MLIRAGLVCLVFWLTVSPADAVAPGERAPEITGTSMDGGKPLKLSKLRGKIVYLDFWATWCAPCRALLPELAKMRSELAPKGFEVLGINLDTEPELAAKLLRDAGARYPNLREVDEDMLRAYAMKGMPAAYIIDRKGVVRAVHEGFRVSQFTAMRAEVEKLLGEKNK